jgi:hypothetical protein
MEDITPRIVAGERRMTMLLVGYWQESRKGRRCPLASDFREAVSAALLTDCFTYEPAETGEGGRLRDIGAALARACGVASTEMALAEAPPNTLIGVAVKSLARALKEATPVLDDGVFEQADGVRRVYRATLLPLENEAGKVALVVGGARCKAG